MLGLIDVAPRRFDEARGIKFETFAERRVRGAMIDALRRDAWPRGVRRQRREIEAAREQLRRELGAEPIAGRPGRAGWVATKPRLGRTIVRINTIESDVAACRPPSTSTGRRCRPRSCRPSPAAPDKAVRSRGAASACEPPSARCPPASAR